MKHKYAQAPRGSPASLEANIPASTSSTIRCLSEQTHDSPHSGVNAGASGQVDAARRS